MIELKNIHKSFNGNIVLNNLSLEVKSGEIYGLLGANGAGKSTTLNLLLGFLNQDSGIINISNNISSYQRIIVDIFLILLKLFKSKSDFT